MSVIEVQGLRVEKEKTEPGDAGKWGGEEYKYCIARDVQDELRKKITESSAIAGGDVKFSVDFGDSDIMLSPEGAFNFRGAFINPERMADRPLNALLAGEGGGVQVDRSGRIQVHIAHELQVLFVCGIGEGQKRGTLPCHQYKFC